MLKRRNHKLKLLNRSQPSLNHNKLKNPNQGHPTLRLNRFGNKRLRVQKQSKIGNLKLPSLNQTKSGNLKMICQKETFKMIQDFIKIMFQIDKFRLSTNKRLL
ncbi:hypothetical protein Hanom_Chr08g00745641 [Helianthus anomalus]